VKEIATYPASAPAELLEIRSLDKKTLRYSLFSLICDVNYYR
jgi:hypothetical protein